MSIALAALVVVIAAAFGHHAFTKGSESRAARENVESQEDVSKAVSNTVTRLRSRATSSAETILQLYELGSRAVPLLLPAFHDPDDEVRSTIMTVTGLLAHQRDAPVADVVDALASALKDPSVDVRFSALLALKSLGPRSALAVPSLCELLRQENATPDQRNPEIRLTAVETLGRIGPAAEIALPEVLRVYETSSGYLRQQTAIAIQQIRHDTHLQQLRASSYPLGRVLDLL